MKRSLDQHIDTLPPSEKPLPYNFVGAIMDYENGTIDEDGALELFQYLVDTGMAWTLQGSYGRTAMALIQAGTYGGRNDCIAYRMCSCDLRIRC